MLCFAKVLVVGFIKINHEGTKVGNTINIAIKIRITIMIMKI